MRGHLFGIGAALLAAGVLVAAAVPAMAWPAQGTCEEDPIIYDEGEYTCDSDCLRAWWVPAGETEYIYAIGTGTEGDDLKNVVPWTVTNGENHMIRCGLDLQTETTYYISVRYQHLESGQQGFCYSDIVTSDGIEYVDWDRTYGYDDENGVRTIVNANGTSVRFTYDERNRLRQVKNLEPDGDGITGAVLNYSVDGAGNRTDIWFNEDYTNSRNVFDYDKINRLEEADYYNMTDASFTYDWVGNRSQAGTYSYDAADRLGGTSYPWSYYGTGSLKAISGSPTLTFTYDPRELLSVAGEEE